MLLSSHDWLKSTVVYHIRMLEKLHKGQLGQETFAFPPLDLPRRARQPRPQKTMVVIVKEVKVVRLARTVSRMRGKVDEPDVITRMVMIRAVVRMETARVWTIE